MRDVLVFFLFFSRISGTCNVTTLKPPQSQFLERNFKNLSCHPRLGALAILSAHSALPSGAGLDPTPGAWTCPLQSISRCALSHTSTAWAQARRKSQ